MQALCKEYTRTLVALVQGSCKEHARPAGDCVFCCLASRLQACGKVKVYGLRLGWFRALMRSTGMITQIVVNDGHHIRLIGAIWFDSIQEWVLDIFRKSSFCAHLSDAFGVCMGLVVGV